MQRWESVAIVGVGLIGASIGMGLRQRGLARRVIGIGRREATLATAFECGAVTETTTDLAHGVAEAEVVIACTPVARIAEALAQAARACRAECLLTDAGSTKVEIVAELEKELPAGARFVGSHPLAGGEKSGPEFGRADLLEGRTVVVTPTRRSPPEDVTAVEDFWQALGARVVRMSPEKHDQALAATSHLPHLIASAIAGSTPKQYAALVATGWLDTTRIAAGDPELWTQIFLGNREQVLESLDRFEAYLAELRGVLERAEEGSLEKLLTQAKRMRDALGS